MPRLGPEDRLVIATHNPGKLREIAELIAPFGVEAVSAGALGLPEPEETGSDFVENAVLKARAAAEAAGLPALADDSWAGPGRDFRIAMERVERELTGKGDRRAAFVCVLCLYWPGGAMATFEGRCTGDLVWPPRGGQGFGYDPIFRPEGHGVTFGEMAPAEKHRIDHRSRAFAELEPAVFGDPDG